MAGNKGSKIREKFVWSLHSAQVYGMATCLAAGDYFYSCGGDGKIIAWAYDSKKPRWLVQLTGPLYAIACVPSWKALVVGGREGLYLYDLETGKKLHLFSIADEVFYDICVHEGRLLVAQGSGALGIINLDTQQQMPSISLSTQRLRSIALNPADNECLVAGSDNVISVLDASSYALKQHLHAHENSVFSLCFTPNNVYFLSGSRDTKINLWHRLASGSYELFRELRGHRGTVNSVAMRADGSYFLSGSLDGTIKLWQTNNLSLLGVAGAIWHRYHARSVNRVLWVPGRPAEFLSCSDDKHIVLWGLDGSLCGR